MWKTFLFIRALFCLDSLCESEIIGIFKIRADGDSVSKARYFHSERLYKLEINRAVTSPSLSDWSPL